MIVFTLNDPLVLIVMLQWRYTFFYWCKKVFTLLKAKKGWRFYFTTRRCIFLHF